LAGTVGGEAGMEGGSVIESSADFSPCGKYRYSLTRRWDMFDDRRLIFIGLNPSTANATMDDPTIRRCIGFAKGFGFGGMVMLNLFAFISAYPSVMMVQTDPIGPDTDLIIKSFDLPGNKFVACWGHWKFKERAVAVMRLISQPIYCLGLTRDGDPRHPLYLKRDCQLEEFHVCNNGRHQRFLQGAMEVRG